MAHRSSRAALAGLLGVLSAGCSGGESTRTPHTAEDSTVAPPDLDRYLLRTDEGPRLEPMMSAQTDTGEPFDLPREGAELLERSGYVSTTYQPGEGNGIAGVSSVLLFDAEAGARDWMAYETSIEALRHQIPDGTFNRFEVSEVPGASGWTGPDLHGNAIGQVYWTQGRCMLTIAVETEGSRVEPLVDGAEAIYGRTGGTCP